jgi:hypothetical protein
MHERKMHTTRPFTSIALRLIKVAELLERAIYQRRRVDISKIYSSYVQTDASELAGWLPLLPDRYLRYAERPGSRCAIDRMKIEIFRRGARKVELPPVPHRILPYNRG